jgi:hypothetical protein
MDPPQLALPTSGQMQFFEVYWGVKSKAMRRVA